MEECGLKNKLSLHDTCLIPSVYNARNLIKKNLKFIIVFYTFTSLNTWKYFIIHDVNINLIFRRYCISYKQFANLQGKILPKSKVTVELLGIHKIRNQSVFVLWVH